MRGADGAAHRRAVHRMLFLAKHVHVCSDGARCVLLDTRRDEYTAIAAETAAGLADIVPGWPPPSAPRPVADRETTERVIRELLRRDVLTADEAKGKGAWPDALPAATATLWPPQDPLLNGHHKPFPSGRTVTRFVLACLRAGALLRWRSLEHILDRHARIHGRASVRIDDPTSSQLLVDDFRLLRPLFFTSSQHCLFHALALAEFLAIHKVSTRWVFGVQFVPFAAHCWLQQGAVVLNDNLEHVQRFTPIMAG